MPLVLFGEHGRTVEGYRPADEDLAAAAPAPSHQAGAAVAGPHLRVARTRHARNKTGVVGISFGTFRKRGKLVSAYFVQLGSAAREFRIDTLGKREAWRRAVALRCEHVRKTTLANAVILAARQDNEGKVA